MEAEWRLSGKMPKFQGASYNAVDDKGRVIIPQRFRSSLGERFVMTRGFDGCIFVFTMEMWNLLSQKFDEAPLFGRDKVRLQRFLFSHAQEVQPDSQGRVAIPQELRMWAAIEPNSEVMIAGCTNWIEIWSRERYDNLMMQELDLSDELMAIAEKLNI